MRRILPVTLLTAVLAGCSGGPSGAPSIGRDEVTTTLEDGTRLFVLSVPAMT